uniref:HAT C-terminal dimerisation domain-containing protein n=1 Tax=Cajanus cajan TaxID=3821 RepID=A0A151S123_CAJCA|nr:hypothetical protein KK1_029906 [Cajanus cajan]
MEMYFKRKSFSEQSSSPQIPVEKEVKLGPSTKKRFLECDLEKLLDDPCLRPKISNYLPSDRDEIGRYYLGEHKDSGDVFITEGFTNKLIAPTIQKDVGVALFFNLVANISNVVGASCREKDIAEWRISSGCGLNQETTIKKARDTRWTSHYGTLLSLLSLFPSMIDVLEIVEEDDISLEQKGEACALLNSMQTFEFIFLNFSPIELLLLDNQLENYFTTIYFDSAFSKLERIGDLFMKLVEIRKYVVYPLVYLLLELTLILPMTTISVERVFSVTNIIKN